MLCMYARPACQLFKKILLNAQAICFASNLYIYTVNFLQASRQYRYFTVNGLLKLVRNTLNNDLIVTKC